MLLVRFLCLWLSWLFTAWVSMPLCFTECDALEVLFKSSSVCLAACWMFAGSLAWLFIGFHGACAQLSKRMLVPWRLCTKHLRASLNKQPQPCSSSCQLSWAAPGEGKAKSFPGKESGKNSCLINKSIDSWLINVFFKLYLKAPDRLPLCSPACSAQRCSALCPSWVVAIPPGQLGMWGHPTAVAGPTWGIHPLLGAMAACAGTMNFC